MDSFGNRLFSFAHVEDSGNNFIDGRAGVGAGTCHGLRSFADGRATAESRLR
jgi:hypothetical protein